MRFDFATLRMGDRGYAVGENCARKVLFVKSFHLEHTVNKHHFRHISFQENDYVTKQKALGNSPLTQFSNKLAERLRTSVPTLIAQVNHENRIELNRIQ